MRVPINRAVLRRAREDIGLTQHQLARALGMAGGERISKWELGTANPRLDMLATLAHVLQVDIETLLAPGAELTGLRGLRARRGLTVREAADLCHVSLATYSRWEKGSQVRGPEFAIEVLAHAMEVSTATVEDALRQMRR